MNIEQQRTQFEWSIFGGRLGFDNVVESTNQ